ncbi:Rossmann-like and DUF2520 domain-containing protein [Salinibacter ruber]|uniref:Short-subunit dehydrogenase-like oxidoreductase (DUF2520 family) n=1 Tax=Salinibacter ruber TaxID=146919 RepID=A0A9X2PTC2_9BACT|nr:DUF2520 domain-containing protein [Salinibacter ruber]MCS3635508.1 putative short-subunit dehydrogenase-like oxidoreductase (DUF2520 family) [Salinibacter ruber]MCS3657153.1 putative short-subunit dehydrogenase-like oxidoreductase (DUF2520 family) [Salinibacter ruber]MCS3667311.1 putative short-subunit dehydrogenase-like oxidoreductase (DUF2520 family) [Salinibacter ruber]MCS3714998.1 putative short-subunit dehydrogenase-like oxidoreductase (DUF2520 family) [Salinibacter ruber]MCS3952124.1 
MSRSAPIGPIAIVGAGALGTALARGLSANGHQVEAVVSRNEEDARALANRVGASVAGMTGTALPASVRLVLICVPDDAIEEVAEDLGHCDHPWGDTVVAHTSGARRAAVLDSLARQGAAPMSFHPVQTFTEETPPEAFEGIVVGLEGDDRALAVGEALAGVLGAQPLRLTPDEKARYHCAAALASNGLVALLAVVEEVLGGLKEDDSSASGTALVAPLVEHTWANLKEGRPEEVLTGPVMRGDTGTVRAHLDALEREAPHLVPVYAALSREMVRVAARGGHLSDDQAEALRSSLGTVTDADPDSER